MTSRADPRSVSLPQHADEHRPKYPILLAVDQELSGCQEAEVAIAGVGRQYDLEPGGSVELPVAIAVEHFEIPPGEYITTAVVPELGLTSPPARVFVVTR
jgi:hypothetical protein